MKYTAYLWDEDGSMFYQLYVQTGHCKLPLRINFYKTKFMAMFMISPGVTGLAGYGDF
jgi:hypothetical protein